MTTLTALLEVEQDLLSRADYIADEAHTDIDFALFGFEAQIAKLRNHLNNVQSAGGTSTGTIEQLAYLRNRLNKIAERATRFAEFSQPAETPMIGVTR